MEKTKIVLGILIAFATTGAVALAAQASYPGTPLYPVKVGVNENMGSIVAIDTASEAETQAKIFAERLEEIEKLSAEKELDSKTVEEIREEIGDQFDKTFELILAVESKGNIAEAAVARATVQSAIDYRMNSEIIFSSALNDDLSIYSKILTESLIQNSLNT